MARPFFWTLLLVLIGARYVTPAAAGARLSALGRTLAVFASPKVGQVLHAGEDTMTVTWHLNATSSAAGSDDARYEAVRLVLCYALASQEDRGWRKAHDDLGKDRACQHRITQQTYDAGAEPAAAFEYRVASDVPTASYHVRAYALDASGEPVAYGETAPDYYFCVAGVTGVSASLRVAAGVFSAFSVAALVFLLVVENRRKNK